MKKNIQILDLGKHPVSNRFVSNKNVKQKKYQLVLNQNINNGIIELKRTINYKDLIPKLPWVTYSEPEDHLDQLVKNISKKYLKNKQSIIGGISFKDDSLLKRFNKLGFKTWRIDHIKDLKANKNGGVESIQHHLNKKNSLRISKKYGNADLLIVRHVWEHVYDQKEFSLALINLVRKDGLILLEIPDYDKIIKKKDYTMVWEEHLYYYNTYTFKQSIYNNKFQPISISKVKYPSEDIIIGIVKKSNKKNIRNIQNKNELEKIKNSAKNYGKNFLKYKDAINNKLENYRSKKKIVLFGAGHTAVAFISYFAIKRFISFVIDDNKNKNGFYMPNTNIKIIMSNKINFNDISVCLISVNQMHENKIYSKLKNELNFKGRIFSIFPTSKRFILNK
tara:strand:+ start:129 stop:1304 length:1176 start_codon:yes stop_codon:yes gene_type:complete